VGGSIPSGRTIEDESGIRLFALCLFYILIVTKLSYDNYVDIY